MNSREGSGFLGYDYIVILWYYNMILLNPGYYDMIYIYVFISYFYLSLVYVIFVVNLYFINRFAFFEALHRGLRPAPVGRLYL